MFAASIANRLRKATSSDEIRHEWEEALHLSEFRTFRTHRRGSGVWAYPNASEEQRAIELDPIVRIILRNQFTPTDVLVAACCLPQYQGVQASEQRTAGFAYTVFLMENIDASALEQFLVERLGLPEDFFITELPLEVLKSYVRDALQSGAKR